jgi:hypothetical protein
VTRYLWAEGAQSSEICGGMAIQYSDNFMGQRKAYEWVLMLKARGNKFCL